MELRSKRRREQRIDALLAQLSVDSDTLLSKLHLACVIVQFFVIYILYIKLQKA